MAKQYSYVTGPDDSKFCERVTEKLNEGWELYGSPSLAYDSDTARMMCGQAIVKNDRE